MRFNKIIRLIGITFYGSDLYTPRLAAFVTHHWQRALSDTRGIKLLFYASMWLYMLKAFILEHNKEMLFQGSRPWKTVGTWETKTSTLLGIKYSQKGTFRWNCLLLIRGAGIRIWKYIFKGLIMQMNNNQGWQFIMDCWGIVPRPMFHEW